jgi:hypothetical protein
MAEGGMNLRIDSYNYSGPGCSDTPMNHKGQVVRLTIGMHPPTGSYRVWLNGNLVCNLSGQNIGPGGLNGIQQLVTTFPAQQQVQYLWDTVIWY